MVFVASLDGRPPVSTTGPADEPGTLLAIRQRGIIISTESPMTIRYDNHHIKGNFL